jgi:hypothetical protein
MTLTTHEAIPMGLYSNIAAKNRRIKAGSGETMREVGDKGAPARGAFAAARCTRTPTAGRCQAQSTRLLARC